MSPLAAGALLPTERAGVVQVRAPNHWQASQAPTRTTFEGVRDTTRHDTTHDTHSDRVVLCGVAILFKIDIVIGRRGEERLDALSCTRINTHTPDSSARCHFGMVWYLDRWVTQLLRQRTLTVTDTNPNSSQGKLCNRRHRYYPMIACAQRRTRDSFSGPKRALDQCQNSSDFGWNRHWH